MNVASRTNRHDEKRPDAQRDPRHRRRSLLAAGLLSLLVAVGLAGLGEAQTLIGEDAFRISFAGPDGSTIHDAAHDGIAFDSVHDRYLVVWDADDRIPGEGATFNGKREVFGRLVGGDGRLIGEPRLLATAGPSDDERWDAENPEVVFNSVTGEYLAVWVATVAANSNAAKREIFARRVSAEGVPLGAPVRVTRTGGDTDLQRDSKEPSLAFNAVRNEFLIVWQREQSDRNSFSEQEIYAQRLDGSTAALIGDAIRVSKMGPDGSTAYDALDPDVAWAPVRDEYLVVWRADHDRGGVVNGEFEIFGQRLSSTAVPVDDQLRISYMGPDGNPDFDAEDASLAYNPDRDEWLVAWTGLDDVVVGEEVYAQRLSGTLEPRGDLVRVSQMGPEGAQGYPVDESLVIYNQMDREYFVIWMGQTDQGLLSPGEIEVFGQRLDEDGAALGVDDARISSLGPDGDSRFDAFSIGLEYNSLRGETMAVFAGDDDRGGQVDNEVEIFGQRVANQIPPCVDDFETVCLAQDRFAVRVDWKSPDGQVSAAQANRLSEDTSWFWFFEDTNVELVIKVLDARGVNGRFWVFFGALSDVEYVIDVLDTETGQRREYRNEQGILASLGDTAAFPLTDSSVLAVPMAAGLQRVELPTPTTRLAETAPAGTPCEPSATVLCLNNGRFRLEVDWTTAQSAGVGRAVELTRDTGWFWFFDAANTELIVKVLDARAINGSFWVYFGSLSDVNYRMRITDTVSGVTRTYENQQGVFASVGDVNAFPQ